MNYLLILILFVLIMDLIRFYSDRKFYHLMLNSQSKNISRLNDELGILTRFVFHGKSPDKEKSDD